MSMSVGQLVIQVKIFDPISTLIDVSIADVANWLHLAKTLHTTIASSYNYTELHL